MVNPCWCFKGNQEKPNYVGVQLKRNTLLTEEISGGAPSAARHGRCRSRAGRGAVEHRDGRLSQSVEAVRGSGRVVRLVEWGRGEST